MLSPPSLSLPETDINVPFLNSLNLLESMMVYPGEAFERNSLPLVPALLSLQALAFLGYHSELVGGTCRSTWKTRSKLVQRNDGDNERREYLSLVIDLPL